MSVGGFAAKQRLLHDAWELEGDTQVSGRFRCYPERGYSAIESSSFQNTGNDYGDLLIPTAIRIAEKKRDQRLRASGLKAAEVVDNSATAFPSKSLVAVFGVACLSLVCGLTISVGGFLLDYNVVGFIGSIFVVLGLITISGIILFDENEETNL